MTGVLITRPYAKSVIVSNQLQEQGYHTHIAPCLQAVPITFMAPNPQNYKALLFTSAQAVKALSSQLKQGSPYFDLPVLCVGNNTQQKAQKCGFTEAHSADGNAKDLHSLIVEHHKKTVNNEKPYLYVRAQNVAAPIEKWLSDKNIAVTGLVTYKTEITNSIPYEVITNIKEGSIQSVLFFSKRTADNFVNLIRKHNLEQYLNTIKALSISAGVLGCLEELNWELTDHAKKPTKENLYDLLNQHCPSKAK